MSATCGVCGKSAVYTPTMAGALWVHADTGRYVSLDPQWHDVNTSVVQLPKGDTAMSDSTTSIVAELAPLGVQLWPTHSAKYAPNFTLDNVAIVRDSRGEYVVWTYESGETRTFRKGELVTAQLPAGDPRWKRDGCFDAPVHMTYGA